MARSSDWWDSGPRFEFNNSLGERCREHKTQDWVRKLLLRISNRNNIDLGDSQCSVSDRSRVFFARAGVFCQSCPEPGYFARAARSRTVQYIFALQICITICVLVKRKFNTVIRNYRLLYLHSSGDNRRFVEKFLLLKKTFYIFVPRTYTVLHTQTYIYKHNTNTHQILVHEACQGGKLRKN